MQISGSDRGKGKINNDFKDCCGFLAARIMCHLVSYYLASSSALHPSPVVLCNSDNNYHTLIIYLCPHFPNQLKTVGSCQ